jgi:hypothetical protein
MSTFDNLQKGFPATIKPPIELQKLCDWADANNHNISGYFELYADEEGKALEYWSQANYLNDHFAQFGLSPNGSPIGIWKNDEGKEYILRLDSEGAGQSIVAENFVDFLRILAIGYGDISESGNYTLQEANVDEEDKNQGFNPTFKAWVEKEFQTTVPTKGDEVYVFENTLFDAWLKKRRTEYGVQHLAEYELFALIGKDIKALDLYAVCFESKKPCKLKEVLYLENKLSGISAVLNTDYTIRSFTLNLGGRQGFLYYSDKKPAELEGSESRKEIQQMLGKPFSQGRKDKYDWVLYQIETTNGLRSMQIIYRSEPDLDNIGRIIIS